MTATVDKSPPDDQYGPVISQSVAGIFAVFGLAASLGMGWMLARSTSGQPPFQLPGKTTTAAKAEAQTVKIVATDLKFDTNTLQVAAPGEIDVQFLNNGLIDHDVTVEGARFTLPGRPGKSAEKTLKIDKPGTYTFYCSIPGHREAGMQGKLVVGDGKGAAAASAATAAKAGAANNMAGMPGMPGMTADQHVSHATTATAESHGNQ